MQYDQFFKIQMVLKNLRTLYGKGKAKGKYDMKLFKFYSFIFNPLSIQDLSTLEKKILQTQINLNLS